MAELNQYSIYGLSNNATIPDKDKVDSMVDVIIDLHDYMEVKDFVQENFGDIEGAKWFLYPEYDKKVYVLNEEDKVEICMIKKNKQYYGKGWIPIK